MTVMKKPPIGVMPRYIWEARRKRELGRAIYEYLNAGLPILPEWVNEYNELCNRNKQPHKEA